MSIWQQDITWTILMMTKIFDATWHPFGAIEYKHYSDVIMGAIASQITGLTIVYSFFHSGTDQIKHQSSASLAFVRWIHRWPVNSPHKKPVMWKMFPFDDVIMYRYFVARYVEAIVANEHGMSNNIPLFDVVVIISMPQLNVQLIVYFFMNVLSSMATFQILPMFG